MNHNEIIVTKTFKRFYDKIKNGEIIIDKSGSKTVELIGETLYLNPKYPKINILDIRKTPKYADREIDWYESQSLYVKDIPGKTPKIWNQVSDKNGKINSNYGYLVYSKENYNQFDNCLNILINNKNSRRATMIYNRPSIHEDYNKDGMSDFICTYYNQFFIRNDQLISIYNMRSNDMIYGFFNDFYWACHIYNKLYNELVKVYPNLKFGNLVWQTSSLHVYERHFPIIIDIYNKIYKEYIPCE